MELSLLLVGINHKTSDIEIREKLYFTEDRARSFLRTLPADLPSAKESVLISTCNRTECYFMTSHSDDTASALLRRLGNGIPRIEELLNGSAYRWSGLQAMEHLFSVTSSLDSMLPGETQITGQVRDAYRWAHEEGTVGYYMHKTFQKALQVAKRVRRETRIGENVVSLSHAAVELARKVFADFSERTLLVIGTGEMGELAAHQARKQQVKKLIVTSRTEQRAAALASQTGGIPHSITELESLLRECDLVIASAAAPEPMVTTEMVRRILPHRRGRTLVLIDLGMPRNIQADIHTLENVYVYDLDDLQQIIHDSLTLRQEEAAKGRLIVHEAAESFMGQFHSQDIEQVIVFFRQKLEAIGKKELDRFLPKMDGLSPEQKELVQNVTHNIVQKVLHEPITRLKQESSQGSGLGGPDAPSSRETASKDWLKEALVELFNLKPS
ncbi:MAG: glutamyl-tRNA reductase [Nitrospirae bacterium]|nr:glutamyl-tRNA reductase [Nitrospirota bacterium]